MKKNKLNNIFVRNVKGGKELVQNKRKAFHHEGSSPEHGYFSKITFPFRFMDSRLVQTCIKLVV
jgi:hypothetical protein